MAVFKSFFGGGFESSTHRRPDGQRLDLIEATGHARHVQADYAAVKAHGLSTVRDGLRWHLIETSPGVYDWSSFLPMLKAAQAAGVQPIWDLCHYGVPDFIDIWRPVFVERFAAFARAVAEQVRAHSDEVPIYCPVNEISFWSWAGGDVEVMTPLARGRGNELKHQLVRAALAGVDAVRSVDPRARFLHVDPVINILPRTPEESEEATGRSQAQFDAWKMLSGELWPGLGGQPEALDILGVNYYPHNQWFLHGDMIPRGNPLYRPFRELLADTYQRFGRPLYVAETGTEGEPRASWLAYVCEEVAAAREAGVPVEGICLYPVTDYPGWVDDRHCETGLLGLADAEGRRGVHTDLAQELKRQLARFE